MTKERLVTFTDAILAIIMTILVLDLEKPETPDFMGLWNLREPYMAYALSFFWLAVFWINLTKTWKDAETVKNPVLWWSMVTLFFASLIPYVTSYAGAHFYDAFAQVFYGIIVILVSLSNLIVTYFLAKANIDDVELYGRLRILVKWMFIDILFKVFGIILAIYVYPPLSMVLIIISAFIPTVRLIHFKKRIN